MSVFEIHAPPLPHYINSGSSVAGLGRKHPERYAIGEFDLVVVSQGCLYIGEEERTFDVAEGHALILHPDLHHYPTRGCSGKTTSFWLHFQTRGNWRMLAGANERQGGSAPVAERNSFPIRIPQFSRLIRPANMYEHLSKLNELEKDSHVARIRWEQQHLFQEVLMLLGEGLEARSTHPSLAVAEQAASWLREYYRSAVNSRDLGLALNFHPVYIARCMKRHFHCSPMEYLLRYRLEQARLLLLQTDLPVLRIAEETGFNQAAYFTSCFVKWEGLTPREYRKGFVMKGVRDR